jgi:hypothetical protein
MESVYGLPSVDDESIPGCRRRTSWQKNGVSAEPKKEGSKLIAVVESRKRKKHFVYTKWKYKRKTKDESLWRNYIIKRDVVGFKVENGWRNISIVTSYRTCTYLYGI